MSKETQRVTVNGVVSAWQPVTSGVPPQSSISGPALCCVLINDLHARLSKSVDDSKLGGAADSFQGRGHREISTNLRAG